MSIKLSDLSINIPETIGETVLLVEEHAPILTISKGSRVLLPEPFIRFFRHA